jgi:branched-chain amino acid transport system ATP-binding protein
VSQASTAPIPAVPILAVRGLHAYYGKSHVLQGVDLTVGEGEIVALLGRNGAGRSTLAKAIMGLVDTTGSARLRGDELVGRRAFEIARRGVGYVPESRDVFPTLTVRQNLRLGEQRNRTRSSPRWTVGDLFALFPQLAVREHVAAALLSGGEQQMLALCRTLMGDPDLLLIDEPTEGLAPRLVDELAATLTTLRGRGVAVLLIEQKLAIALDVSQRLYVMGHGRVVFEGTPQALGGAPEVRREWLEV